jgi:hypothetical protein
VKHIFIRVVVFINTFFFCFFVLEGIRLVIAPLDFLLLDESSLFNIFVDSRAAMVMLRV